MDDPEPLVVHLGQAVDVRRLWQGPINPWTLFRIERIKTVEGRLVLVLANPDNRDDVVLLTFELMELPDVALDIPDNPNGDGAV